MHSPLHSPRAYRQLAPSWPDGARGTDASAQHRKALRPHLAPLRPLFGSRLSAVDTTWRRMFELRFIVQMPSAPPPPPPPPTSRWPRSLAPLSCPSLCRRMAISRLIWPRLLSSRPGRNIVNEESKCTPWYRQARKRKPPAYKQPSRDQVSRPWRCRRPAEALTATPHPHDSPRVACLTHLTA